MADASADCPAEPLDSEHPLPTLKCFAVPAA